MFMAALILVLSLAALLQFGWFYWRALLVSTASEAISDSLWETAGLSGQEVQGEDFHALLGLREVCPNLGAGKEHWGCVKVYYQALSLVGSISGGPVKQWALTEQAACSRYAAVLLDRRLRANAQYLLSLNEG